MAWQLIYTSAPALLDAGRTGFGTVARHEAIRPTLQTELERISQFSREQGLSKERILFYHRAIDLRGERYHVLSRIKDAGSDYTGRTNHIAHHIVLTAVEADQVFRSNRCTPADMILWITSNGLWRDHWNEPARLFDSQEEIAIGSIPARLSLPAVTWGSVTGNAANAAILAPGAAATEGCWLLFREDKAAQLLPLIGESLCLNPNPWNISFSIDTQPTDRIEEIQWRGVAAGSPLEGTARQSVRPVVDLGNTSTLTTPVDDYANLAATGLKKAPEPAATHRKLIAGGGSFAAQATSSSSSAATLSTVGKVSLKEKMKRQEASAQSVKEKRIPIGGILLSVFSLLILALVVIIWDACIFDRGEGLMSLKNNTAIIINRITSKQRRPDDLWWEKRISQMEILRIFGSSYSLMKPEKKANVINASKILSEIVRSADCKQKLEDYKDQEGILGEIIKQISLEKEAVDNQATTKAAQEEPDRKKKEAAAKAAPTPSKKDQSITLKIGGNPISSGMSIPATNGQKLQIEAISSSEAPVSIHATGAGSVSEDKTLAISGAGTVFLNLSVPGSTDYDATETNIQIVVVPPTAKISKIEFWDPSKDTKNKPANKFFGEYADKTNCPYPYNTNISSSEGILDFINQLKNNNSIAWNNEGGFRLENKINRIANDSPIFIFSKKDSGNQISVIISINGTATNKTAPFYTENTTDHLIALVPNPEVESFLRMATNGSSSLKANFSVVKIGDNTPKYPSASLQALSEQINAEWNCALSNSAKLNQQLDEQKIGTPQTNAPQAGETSSCSTNNQSAVEACFLNAGIKVFEGILIDQKPFMTTNSALASFNIWKSQNKQKGNPPTYRAYLLDVLNKIPEVTNKGAFKNLATISGLKDHNGDISLSVMKLTERVKNEIKDEEMVGDGSSEDQQKNKRLLANLRTIFTIENANSFSSIASLNEGEISREEKQKTNERHRLVAQLKENGEEVAQYEEIKANLRKGAESTAYKSQLELRDGNRAILIFISP